MNVHDDLQLEWANIEGEGLVRVFPVRSFREGFVLITRIGQAAEKADYYPELVLTQAKVTVTIPPQAEGLDHRLAHAIDAELGYETTQYA